MRTELVAISTFLVSSFAWAEVPNDYTLVFRSGFHPGVSVAGGNACGDRRYLTGTDSITGYSWDLLPGSPSTNYFNDLIENGPPDCCPSGCSATSKDECHTIEIVPSVKHYDGTTGYALKGVLKKDCSDSSYSRIQYNMFDADPPVAKPLDDLVAYYAEVELTITNPELVPQQGGWLDLIENYDPDHNWKSTLGLDCIGGGGCPKFFMYNCEWGTSSCVQTYDNVVIPEAGVPFRLRAWYRASTTAGLWKVTYTCPSCTPPVGETMIHEFTGQTIDEGDLDVADLIKMAGTWGGMEVYWTGFLWAAPNSGVGGTGGTGGGGEGGAGGSAGLGMGGLGAGGSVAVGGSSGMAGRTAAGGGLPADGGADNETPDEGGCGCRAGGDARVNGSFGLGALIVGALAFRRRALARLRRNRDIQAAPAGPAPAGSCAA